MRKPRCEQGVLEDRTSRYLAENESARAIRCSDGGRLVVLNGFKPRCQMQQIPIVASRLHVVAAVLEAEAGLPACLRGLLLGPSEESDFGARDGVVNNAAGFFRETSMGPHSPPAKISPSSGFFRSKVHELPLRSVTCDGLQASHSCL